MAGRRAAPLTLSFPGSTDWIPFVPAEEKGSDYKQINRVGPHGGGPAPGMPESPVTGGEIESA